MAEILKHVGKYGEKPCVVVFREIPNEPENCLIVESASLEERDHDDLMATVTSVEAQSSGDISQVLARRQLSNGEQMLNYLHFHKKLQKVPVSLVSLTPTPSLAARKGLQWHSCEVVRSSSRQRAPTAQ